MKLTVAIGGTGSHEFMVLADRGKRYCHCANCNYAGNLERLPAQLQPFAPGKIN